MQGKEEIAGSIERGTRREERAGQGKKHKTTNKRERERERYIYICIYIQRKKEGQ